MSIGWLAVSASPGVTSEPPQGNTIV
jgi:hypothetical protein